MPSHFSAIGFPVDDASGLEPLARLAVDSGEPIAAPGGVYVRWEVGGGVELWLQVVGEEVVAVTPHFTGESRLSVGLVERITRAHEGPLDGAFHAFASPRADKVDGEHAFVFDAPDAHRYADLPLPTLADVQLAGFAHQLVGYRSESAYRLAQPEFALRVGRFDKLLPAPDAPTDQPEDAFARLTGIVKATETRTNPFSGAPFVWARLAVPGGELDVVCDPTLLMGDPLVVGGVADGIYWLSGRVLRAG